MGNFPFTIASIPVLGTLPASYPMGTGGSYPGGKAAGSRSWLLASTYCRG